MSCNVVNSQSQVQSRLPSLPQTLPKTQADWNAVLATFNQWGSILQQASHAPNVIPSQFQTFTVSAATAVIAALSSANCTPSVDATQQYYGAASLKVAISASGATLAFAGYPISIAPASRWFASFQIYAPSGCTGSLTVKTSAGHSVTESFTISALAEWQQVWGLVDLRQYADTQATWQFTFTSTATVWLDGLQMNAVGSPIGTLPKFAGTQMVTGALAYQSNLDGVPNGATYSRTLGAYVAAGVPYNYQGAWNSATAYAKGAEVSSGGNYYLATAGSTNQQPPNASYWQLLGPTSLDYVLDGSSYQRMVLGANLAGDCPYNGDFEQWANGQTYPDGWSSNAQGDGGYDPASRSAIAYTGAYSMSLGPNAVHGTGSRPFGVEPGARYKVNLWARCSTASAGGLYARVYWFSDDSGFVCLSGSANCISYLPYWLENVSCSAANTWQSFSATLTAPATAKFARIVLFDTNASVPYLIDRASITPAPSMLNFGNNTNVAQWMHVGTLVLNAGSSATLAWHTGTGYNTGSNQQNIVEVTIRAGNDTQAPNLSGISVRSDGITEALVKANGVRAVATGNSTAVNNHSWEIYFQCNAFTLGPLDIVINTEYGDSFVFDGSPSTPGTPANAYVNESQWYGSLFYGYLNGAGDRRVSPYKGAVDPRGSIPPNMIGINLSYTSTTSSITLSWGSFTLYRSDGTTTTVSAGSATVNGLSASSTYTFYPYVDESTGQVAFATGYSNSAGSPAFAYTASSVDGAAAMYNYGHVPLSSFSATTPASGGGSGGGGGDHFGCLHPALVVELADGRQIRADWLEAGDWIACPSGFTRITNITRKKCADWRHVETNEGSLLVTHDHRFLTPDGEEVRARALSLGDILAGNGRNLEVRALRLSNEIADMVRLEVEGHLYYLNGVLSHNVKP